MGGFSFYTQLSEDKMTNTTRVTVNTVQLEVTTEWARSYTRLMQYRHANGSIVRFKQEHTAMLESLWDAAQNGGVINPHSSLLTDLARALHVNTPVLTGGRSTRKSSKRTKPQQSELPLTQAQDSVSTNPALDSLRAKLKQADIDLHKCSLAMAQLEARKSALVDLLAELEVPHVS